MYFTDDIWAQPSNMKKKKNKKQEEYFVCLKKYVHNISKSKDYACLCALLS